ncbi:MAG: PAS domain-containing protein [Candidatus Riflebacteria bacterium]|nr:PAS domain-containing protein [Candidatus Riflebacteria bacterium]
MLFFDRMDKEMIQAVIENLPMEITIIDAKDEVVAWNKHEIRVFHRPMSCMGLNFRECHPKESLEKVERIVEEMKSGTRNKARFWINLPLPGDSKTTNTFLIEFFALRNPSGKYLGCMECTQNVEDIKKLSGEKRLLD